MISITRYRVWPDGAVQEADTPAHHWKSDDYELVEAPTPEDAWARAKANAPMVPELNYAALCDAAFLQDKRWTQGTTGCVAFARGAEWFRELMLAATPAPAPAQEVASAFTTALDIRLAQGWNLTGNAIPVLYTDTINDYQVRRDDVWLCTTDALKTKQEVGLTASQFDLICQAIDKADTITLEGDYMLDSDDCIGVVRVMQVLFDIAALRAKGGK